MADVFRAVTRPIGKVMYAPPKEKEEELRDVTPRTEPAPAKAVPFLPMHASAHKKYEWCLAMLRGGNSLSKADKEFCRSYRNGAEYQEYKDYWAIREKAIDGFKEEIG